MPCKHLKELLDRKVPDWRNCLTYVNLNNPSDKEAELVLKYDIRRVPSLIINDEKKGGNVMELLNYIKELCISE